MQMKLLCFTRTFPCSENIQRLSPALDRQMYLFSKVMLGVDLFLNQSVIEFHYPPISLKMNVFALNL